MAKKKQNVKFVRIRGRIVPIKSKKKSFAKKKAEDITSGAGLGASFGAIAGTVSTLRNPIAATSKEAALKSLNFRVGKAALIGAGVGSALGALGIAQRISKKEKKPSEYGLDALTVGLSSALFVSGGGKFKALSKVSKALSGAGRKAKVFRAKKRILKKEGNTTFVRFNNSPSKKSN